MKLSITVLLIVGIFSIYQYWNTYKPEVSQVYKPPVKIVEEKEIEVHIEESVLPPPPPQDIVTESEEIQKESQPKIIKTVAKKEIDYDKIREQRKFKDAENKRNSYNKELKELQTKLTNTNQIIVGLENELKRIDDRYEKQNQIENMRKSNRYRGTLPDGESKRLIDRDWNSVNSKLNSNYSYRNKLENEISKLTDKLENL
jgi:chromosome segregation ATPase